MSSDEARKEFERLFIEVAGGAVSHRLNTLDKMWDLAYAAGAATRPANTVSPYGNYGPTYVVEKKD